MKFDPMHIRFAYSLAGATQLPVTGDNHPLSKEAARWIIWSGAVALLLGLSAFVWWQWLESRGPAAAAPVTAIYNPIAIGVPPSIARTSEPQIAEDTPVVQPKIAYPEPVQDDRAFDGDFLSNDALARALDDAARMNFDQAVAVAPDRPAPLVPESEIGNVAGPVNQLAVRLSMDRPQYPELARMAQIEGTVVLNVLVAKDGRVAQVEVVSGPAQLRQAAIAAARTALFQPATMDGRPVRVWIAMPIEFRLRGGA